MRSLSSVLIDLVSFDAITTTKLLRGFWQRTEMLKHAISVAAGCTEMLKHAISVAAGS
jgi:hypothetical protein